MELYENKFPIYENCMISIFGQPGMFVSVENMQSYNLNKQKFILLD